MVVGLASLTCLTRTAFAASISWDAPGGCEVEQFTTRVEALLGRPLARAFDGSLVVQVSAGESPTRQWKLSLELLDPQGMSQGQRAIVGRDCADVARAGSLAAVMAIQATQPQGVSAEPQAIPAKASSLVALVDPPATDTALERHPLGTSEHADRDAAPEEPLGLNLRVALSALGDMGTLGAAALGLGLAVGVALQPFEFGLMGELFPPVTYGVRADRGGLFGLQAGTAWGCLRGRGQSWLPFACANYEMGILTGKGSGSAVTVSRTQTTVWHAIRPEVGVSFPLAPKLELQLRAGLSIALRQPEFVLNGSEVAHKPEFLVGRAAAGVALGF